MIAKIRKHIRNLRRASQSPEAAKAVIDKTKGDIKLATREKKSKISELKIFFKSVLIYGFLINYTASILGGAYFNLLTLIAWGFGYYLVTVELPYVIRKMRA